MLSSILNQLPEPGEQQIFSGLSLPLELRENLTPTSWLRLEKEWLPPKGYQGSSGKYGATSRCPIERYIWLGDFAGDWTWAASAHPGLSCWWPQILLLTWNKYTAKYFSCKDRFWGGWAENDNSGSATMASHMQVLWQGKETTFIEKKRNLGGVLFPSVLRE